MPKNSIIECIGNTPLVKIDEKIHGIKGLEIFAKCEFLNPFGSVKDRTALGLLQDAWNAENIIESSSGNTAKALGVLAGVFDKKFLTVTNRIKQREVEDILKIIGMEVENLPPWPECPDPNDPHSPFATIQKIMAENPGKYYWTDQYSNLANPAIHEKTTAKEIDDDIGTPDFFFGGLGTTGTTLGVSHYFADTGMKTVSIITEARSFLPGIRTIEEMQEVGLFKKELYTENEIVNEQDAIDAMLVLIRKCGLLVWPTSGATFSGMLAYLKKQNPADLVGKKAVFIACDRLEPYTGYLREKRKSLFVTKEEISLSLENTGDTQQAEYADTTDAVELNSGEIIIDMRSFASYEMEHIRWSLNFPFDELRKYLIHDYLPFPKESKLVFVCPFGEESAMFASMATKIGYTTSSLRGGFLEYKTHHPEQIITHL